MTTLELFSVYVLVWLLHIGWIGVFVGLIGWVGNGLLRKAKPHSQYAWSLASYGLLALAIPLAGFLTFNSMPEISQMKRAFELAYLPDTTDSTPLRIQSLGPADFDQVSQEPSNLTTSQTRVEFAADDLVQHSGQANDPTRATARPIAYTPSQQQGQSLDQDPTDSRKQAFKPLSWSSFLLNSRLAKTIAIIYLLGFCAMLVRLVLASWGCRRLVKQATKISDQKLVQVALDTSRQIGLKAMPALLACERIAVPLAVGVFKPVILLPQKVLSSLPTEQLRAILAHEMAHIRRLDHLVVVGQRAIESILFFHPVTWWISSRLTRQREICCDDLVIATGTAPLDYAKSLYHVAHAEQSSKLKTDLIGVAADGANRSQLVTRIGRLLNETPSVRTKGTMRTPSNLGAIALALGFPAILLASAFLTQSEISLVAPEAINVVVEKSERNDSSPRQIADENYPLIEGHVLDENGDPIDGATVIFQEHPYKYPGTRRTDGEFRKRDELTVLAKTRTEMDGAFRFENVRVPAFNSYIDSIYPISIVVIKDGYAVHWKHLEFVSKRPLELTLTKPSKASAKIVSSQKLEKVETELIGIMEPKDWANAIRYTDNPERHIYEGLVWSPIGNTTNGAVELSGANLNLTNLPPKAIGVVKISAEDHLPKVVFITNIENAKDRLAKNSKAEFYINGDEIELSPAASIKLTIVDKATQLPVAGATFLTRKELGASDANGKMELSGLEPEGRFRIGGMYQVQINPPTGSKLLGHSLSVRLSKDDLKHDLTIELEEGLSLTGRVLESESKVGAAGFRVRFAPDVPSKSPVVASIVETNEAGEYTITVPPVEGKVIIANSQYGYEATTEYWTAGPDPTKPIKLGKIVSVEVDPRDSANPPQPLLVKKLADAADRFAKEYIRVTVLDESGNPVPNAKIRFGGVNNNFGFSAPQSRRCDQQGEFKLELLKTLVSYQKVVICAIDPTNSLAGKGVFVRPEDADPDDPSDFLKELVDAKEKKDAPAFEITVKLQPIAKLSGTVIDADSQTPVVGALVRFNQTKDEDIKLWGNFFTPAETDSNGEYELKVFPGLKGYSRVKHPEYANRNSIVQSDYRIPQSGLTTQINHQIVPLKVEASAAVQPFSAPDVSHLSGAEAYELLTKQFIADRKEFNQLTRNMGDPVELQKQIRRCPYSAYVKSMLQVANANEGTPIESKALAWACNVPMHTHEENQNERYRIRRELGDRLMKDFVDSPDIKKSLTNLVYSQKNPMAAAKKIFEANPDKSIKGESLLLTGQILLDGVKRKQYAEDGSWLKTMTQEQLESEAHKVFTQLKEEFAEVPYWRNDNLGTIATMQLFELEHLGEGDVVEDIQGIALDGKPMKLTDFRGKYVVLDFWGSWCGPCVGELPTLNKIAKDFQDDVVVVGVMNDKRAAAQKAIEEYEVGFRNWQEADDGPVQTRWNINSWPTTYLIDPNGKVLSKRLRGEGLFIHISKLLKEKKRKGEVKPAGTESQSTTPKQSVKDMIRNENENQEPENVSVVDSEGLPVANIKVDVWIAQTFIPKGRSPINQNEPKSNWQLKETLISDMGGDVTLATADFTTKQFRLIAKSEGHAGILRIYNSELGVGKKHQIKLKPTEKLIGIVQDYDTGDPISDCLLEVSSSVESKTLGESFKFKTDELGKFELTGLIPDTSTRIRPTKKGYHFFKARSVDVGLRERNGVKRPFKIELLPKQTYVRTVKATKLLLPDVKNMEPVDAFKTLTKHYQQAATRDNDSDSTFHNEPVRRFMHESRTLPVYAYREAFEVLARRSESSELTADSDVQFDALMWVINSHVSGWPPPESFPNELEKRVIELVDRFPLNRKIDDAFLHIRRYHPNRIEALKRVLAEHKDRAVRGRAAMGLAGEFSTKGLLLGAPQYIDVSELKYKQAQERKYCELTLKEYADISDKGYSKQPLSARAKIAIQWLDKYGIGAQAPTLHGKTINEQPISLAGYQGKFVVLHFWGTGSKLDSIREIRKKHPESVQVISIAMGNKEKTKTRAQKTRIDWPILWNPQSGSPFFIMARQPYVAGLKWGLSKEGSELTRFGHFSTIVIDPNGKIVAGGLKGNDLTELIDSLVLKNLEK